MITLIDTLPQYPVTDDVAFVKISTLFSAYSKYPNIALFWQQTDESGNVTGLLSLMNSNAVISFVGDGAEEIISFINMIHPKTVFTSKSNAEKLGLNVNKYCVAFKKQGGKENSKNVNVSAESVYKSINHNNFIEDKDGFIADISHRVRHNCAYFVCEKYGGAIVFFDDKYALLNGIAVDKKMRGKGIGSLLLQKAVSFSESRTVYLCSEEKNIPFYEKNGFERLSEYTYCGVNYEK